MIALNCFGMERKIGSIKILFWVYNSADMDKQQSTGDELTAKLQALGLRASGLALNDKVKLYFVQIPRMAEIAAHQQKQLAAAEALAQKHVQDERDLEAARATIAQIGAQQAAKAQATAPAMAATVSAGASANRTWGQLSHFFGR